MNSEQVQACIVRRAQEQKSAQESRTISTIQICRHCGRTYTPSRGRKNCPCCQELLITKTIILKT